MAASTCEPIRLGRTHALIGVPDLGGPYVVCVKPRVLWRLVHLVPVVAGCDCSWRWWSWWVSGAQAASCSAGVRIPMAECGRVVPVPVDPLGGGDLDGVGLDCWVFFGQCLFVFQAAFVKFRSSLSTSLGVRYPRAE